MDDDGDDDDVFFFLHTPSTASWAIFDNLDFSLGPGLISDCMQVNGVMYSNFSFNLFSFLLFLRYVNELQRASLRNQTSQIVD